MSPIVIEVAVIALFSGVMDILSAIDLRKAAPSVSTYAFVTGVCGISCAVIVLMAGG